MQELKKIFQTGGLSPLEFTMWFSANMWRLLDEEKKQMVDFAIGAYQDISKMKGVPENLISENKILFEEYYNETYNQNNRVSTQDPAMVDKFYELGLDEWAANEENTDEEMAYRKGYADGYSEGVYDGENK